jgi:tetratricopeptide (TPR) repeat protein
LPTSDRPLTLRRPSLNDGSKIVQVRRLIAAGDIAGGRTISDSILAQHPRHPGALIQRSRLESIDDNYRLAREYALSAYRVDVRNKGDCLHLLRRLKTFNLIAELHDFISRLPPELLHDVDIAELICLLLQSLNQPQQALDYVLQAAEYNPASASLQSEIGLTLLNLGRFDEAERHLLECLRISPDHAPAWWQLSRLRKRSADSNHVDDLQREISRANEPRSTALLAYALHRELDELGDHAKAAHALELACTSMKKVVAYSAEEDERLFAMLRSLPTDAAGSNTGPVDAPFTPVFIVGMHRSGTTLLEQLLSGHDDICSGGELYDFTSQLRFSADHHCSTELDLQIIQASGDFDYGAIGKGYLDSVDWRRSGQGFVTDKLPSNFLNIGFILRALPGAKILHMSRDPMETCFSNLREPFSETACRYSYDQTELANYYRQYFTLMQHWRQRFPSRIHDVTYAALATDPAAELKRVTAYLGIEFQPAMLDTESASRSVSTASAVQVRQKPGLPLRPKWQPYRDYLTPLTWRLSEVGQRY